MGFVSPVVAELCRECRPLVLLVVRTGPEVCRETRHTASKSVSVLKTKIVMKRRDATRVLTDFSV